MPRVSIVVPNYNHARYLPKRIDSILAQSFTDYELILLDDASTDDSIRVLNGYTDPRIRREFNTQNSGSTFKQWNKGIGLASCDYVWIAESDDSSDPAFLETLVRMLDANPQVGMAYCSSQVIDEQDRPIGIAEKMWINLPGDERWGSDYVNNGQDECRDYLMFKCTIPNMSSVLFRRHAYIKAGMADETMKLAGDWKLYASILSFSDIAYCAAPLNLFRHHSANVRSRSVRTGMHIIEPYQVLSAIAERYSIIPEQREKSADIWCDRWVRNILKGHTSPSSLLRILSAGRQFDAKIESRAIGIALRLVWKGLSKK